MIRRERRQMCGFCRVSARQYGATLTLSIFQDWAEACIASVERQTVMIRILTTNEPSANTIIVDGQLVSDYVDAVETCIRQAMGQESPVHLFLRNVSHIDEEGRALLSRLAAKGVELSASGLYSSYVVSEIQREPARSSRVARPATIPRIGTSAGQAAKRTVLGK